MAPSFYREHGNDPNRDGNLEDDDDLSEEDKIAPRRFKYRSFNERVKNIKIDVARKIKLDFEDQLQDTDSFFNEALQSWRELNLTIPYVQFSNRVNKFVKSLPQLLHHKDQVVAELIGVLEDDEQEIAYVPILDLVAQLSRDLGADFMPYYPRFLPLIFSLVSSRDADLLEKAFECVAYLFKNLSKELVPDLTPTYDVVRLNLGAHRDVHGDGETEWTGLVERDTDGDEQMASAVPSTSSTVSKTRQLSSAKAGFHAKNVPSKPYIRHFAAESFAFLIRRARGSQLEDAVRLMLGDVERAAEARAGRGGDREEMESTGKALEEGIAWVLVECVKAGDHRLHSRGPIILSACIAHLNSCPTQSAGSMATLRVLTRVSVSLVHHSRAEHFVPVFDCYAAALKTEIEAIEAGGASDEAQGERLRRTMRLVSVILGVRRGNRISDPSRTMLFDLLYRLSLLPISSSTKLVFDDFLGVTASVFLSARLENLLGKGMKLVERIFESQWFDSIGGFTLALCDLDWSGFKQFLMPSVMQAVPQRWKTDERSLLSLLAVLSAHNHLSAPQLPNTPFSVQFPEILAEVLEGKIEGFARNVESWKGLEDGRVPEEILEFADVLHIVPALPTFASKFTPHLAAIIASLSSPSSLPSTSTSASPAVLAKVRYAASPANEAYLLGICLSALEPLVRDDGRADGHAKKAAVKVVEEVIPIVEHFGWHRTVMSALAKLCHTVEYGATERRLTLDKLAVIYPILRDNLLSEDTALRLHTLQVLNAFEQPTIKARSEESNASGPCEVFQKCIEVELTPLSVQHVRDRNMHIRKLATTAATMKLEPIFLDAIVRFMLSQLKVNYKPVWAETIKVIAELTGRFPTEVWELCFAELEKASANDPSIYRLVKPDWASLSTQAGIEDTGVENYTSDIEEFRCHMLAQSDRTLKREIGAFTSGVSPRVSQHVQAQLSSDRLDMINYEDQLLKTLGEIHSVAEKHSRELVTVFFKFVRPELEVLESDDENAPATATRLSLKVVRQKLTSYLELFVKFVNPKALFRSADLHALFMDLLAKGESKIQILALNCLLTWKNPNITPYSGNLRNLLDDVKFRDELSTFSLAQNTEAIDPAHRADVIPIAIRMLYGIMISRRGRQSASQGQQARKTAILAAVSGCAPEELGTLIQLMLVPFAAFVQNDYPHTVFTFNDDGAPVSGKKQVGFLSLLGDVLKHLGPQVVPYWPALLSTTMHILHLAQKKISAVTHTNEAAEAEFDDDEDTAETQPQTSYETSPLRTIRQQGLKRFADFFRRSVNFDFTPYYPAAFESFISPRIPALNRENTQAPSGLLELFAVWASQREFVSALVLYNKQLLTKVFDCLTAVNVKPLVISRIFDVVERLMAYGLEEPSPDEFIRKDVIGPYVDDLLINLASLVEKSSASNLGREELAKRQISILSELASYVTNPEQSVRLLALLAPMLRKPHKLVPERVKTDLLTIFKNLLPLVPDFRDPTSNTFVHNYNLISSLFTTLRGREAKIALTAVFVQFGIADPNMAQLCDTVAALNSFSVKRMDEPDFDRRLAAFGVLNEELYKTMEIRMWLPIIYNMLYFIQDPEELSIRSNAAYALRRFVEVVSTNKDPQFESTFHKVLYPGLRKGLRSRLELVRTEILGVLSNAVDKCDVFPALQEMKGLLAGGDEEANFFNNIHHIQVHRRTRALRRLTEQCVGGAIKSATISEIFVPLIGHFLSVNAEIADHNLVNETIACLGHLASQLAWPSYNGVLRQYLKLASEQTASEKSYVRAITSILVNFHFAMEDEVPVQDAPQTVEGEDDPLALDEAPAVPAEAAISQPTKASRIADAVTDRLLPSLMSYLEQKDKTEDSIRIPIAIGIVKVAKSLPDGTRGSNVTRLVTALAQIMRSKSQDTRNLARDTICKIAITLGPEFFATVIKELRAALQRGPQLHTLAFTAHFLLVHVTTSTEGAAFSDVDDCAGDIVHLSAEVIFGQSGKDLQSEDFRSKMKEVKSSRNAGLDSFKLLGTMVSPKKVSQVLLPIRDILQQTQSHKMMAAVDEVLGRVATGLCANKHLDPAEFLVLCHTLISQNAQFLKPAVRKSVKQNKRNVKEGVDVQLKRDLVKVVDHYAANAHKFVSLGLSLFISASKRAVFDFRDTAIIARLEPMVAIIGNTLYSAEAQVIILGLKGTAAIIKCPLSSLNEALPTFVTQIFKIIKQTGSTEGDVVKCALKTLATVLRDCKSVEVKPAQLSFLLELITPDLENIDRQATLFALLRAIVSRKFVVPEVYDLMDKVSEIMVTNQSTHVQELCRVVYMQFLLDYPQGRSRLKTQMSFLAKNLEYIHETGRTSVMELLSAIFRKFGVELLREYADLFFVALVMVIGNDDSAKCREMAAELVKSLFTRLAKGQRETTLALLHAWIEQAAQPQLAAVAAQVYGLIVDALADECLPYVTVMLRNLDAVLIRSAAVLEDMETSTDSFMEIDTDWQLPYHSLNAVAKLLRTFPDLLKPESKTLSWTAIRGHFLFPHAWVRTASARLIGTLFAAFPVAQPDATLSIDHPLSLAAMLDTTRKLSLQLKSDNLDEGLSLQIVKNLFYVGKCFHLAPKVPSTRIQPTAEIEDNDEKDEEEDKADSEDEAEDEEDAEGDETLTVKDADAAENPLAWIFTKLSHQARSAHLARPTFGTAPNKWSIQPSSIFRWFAAMVSFMSVDDLDPFLIHVLSPLYRIIDDEQSKDPQFLELKNLAQEVQDLLQAKATTNPEAAARRKTQRNDMKKNNQKRKSRAFAEGKIRNNPIKRARTD
uniref:Uncharacterized protein n=1 Tax=Bartheletia paradoxa TaxID=669517 RepID=A0A2D0XI23_9BASI|nr:hypothetical protein SPAR05566 [Bartheletia paradoxa]